ncbi:MAG TPA: hypothetical protein VH141_12160 [Pseudonocardia sp.]|jgi:hypothetical protein|nr:hypothetical protein [Pseudonocardia sp.]
MSADLDRAIDAVTEALAALRAEPGSAEVRDAVDRANDAVDALSPNVTTEVLHRLVVSIADCHRNGVPNSPRLAVCRRSTLVALRLDPRWTRPTSSHRRPVPRPVH